MRMYSIEIGEDVLCRMLPDKRNGDESVLLHDYVNLPGAEPDGHLWPTVSAALGALASWCAHRGSNGAWGFFTEEHPDNTIRLVEYIRADLPYVRTRTF